MAVTIKEIAARAGVTATTVSLTLRDSPRISPGTKQRVLRIVEELEYYPMHSGIILKRGRTDAIALLSTYFQNIMKMELVNGVERAIYGTDYQLRLFYAENGRELEKCKQVLHGQMADAVIALSVLADPAFLAKMRAAGKPVVLVEDVVEGYAGVRFDNRRAARMAVEYLAGAGRRRIAMCLGLDAYGGHCFVDERLAGYQEGLAGLGLGYAKVFDLPHYSLESGRAVAARFLAEAERPDALFFASGDTTACGFIQGCGELGIRIPEDVAVLSCDDSLLAQASSVGLSAVRQPVFEMGAEALKLALAILDGEEGASSRIITLQPELAIRRTA